MSYFSAPTCCHSFSVWPERPEFQSLFCVGFFFFFLLAWPVLQKANDEKWECPLLTGSHLGKIN